MLNLLLQIRRLLEKRFKYLGIGSNFKVSDKSTVVSSTVAKEPEIFSSSPSLAPTRYAKLFRT